MPYQAPIYRPAGWRPPKAVKREYDAHRRKTAARGYDAQWKALRAAYLQSHVLCECDEHKGKDLRVLAEVVDHRVPIAVNPDLRLNWDNLRAMSKRCHDVHTAKTRGWGRGGGGGGAR